MCCGVQIIHRAALSKSFWDRSLPLGKRELDCVPTCPPCTKFLWTNVDINQINDTTSLTLHHHHFCNTSHALNRIPFFLNELLLTATHLPGLGLVRFDLAVLTHF